MTNGVQIETRSPLYNAAFLEISDMLDGKVELSVKRAVFLVEWAYLDGELDYGKYGMEIDSTARALRRFMSANNVEQFRTGGNYALFEYFSRPYSMNRYKPFTYDFEDFGGHEDFEKLFVTKVMRTHSGQCHSLPFYYKVLAEAIGTEAHITFAPQHVFIRHRDEMEPQKWVNVELTTQSLSREIFYVENFSISDEAIRNKIYLYPLDDKETVAYLLSFLTGGYVRKYKDWDDLVWLCAGKTLEYYPQDLYALIQKGNVLNWKLKDYLEGNGNEWDETARMLDRMWVANNDVIQKLGYKNISDEIYEQLLKGVEEEMVKAGAKPEDIEKEIDKTRQTKPDIEKPN